MGVLPQYQNKGVGTALLKWGLQEAAKNEKRVYLTATPIGRILYGKEEFSIMRVVTVNLEKYGKKGDYTQTVMVWDRRAAK